MSSFTPKFKFLSVLFTAMFLFTQAQAQKPTIAVLPFDLVSNDPALMSESMVTELQNTCARAVQKFAPKVNLQSIRTTNSILAKNNLTWQDMSKVAPQEMANMLNVEYVLFGSANIQNKATVTNSSSSTAYHDKNEQKRTSNTKNSKSGGYIASSSTTTTKDQYETRISMEIFSNTGESIQSTTRTSFGNESGAYNATIEYLVKRTPFGTKYKGR